MAYVLGSLGGQRGSKWAAARPPITRLLGVFTTLSAQKGSCDDAIERQAPRGRVRDLKGGARSANTSYPFQPDNALVYDLPLPPLLARGVGCVLMSDDAALPLLPPHRIPPTSSLSAPLLPPLPSSSTSKAPPLALRRPRKPPSSVHTPTPPSDCRRPLTLSTQAQHTPQFIQQATWPLSFLIAYIV